MPAYSADAHSVSSTRGTLQLRPASRAHQTTTPIRHQLRPCPTIGKRACRPPWTTQAVRLRRLEVRCSTAQSFFWSRRRAASRDSTRRPVQLPRSCCECSPSLEAASLGVTHEHHISSAQQPPSPDMKRLQKGTDLSPSMKHTAQEQRLHSHADTPADSCVQRCA